MVHRDLRASSSVSPRVRGPSHSTVTNSYSESVCAQPRQGPSPQWLHFLPGLDHRCPGIKRRSLALVTHQGASKQIDPLLCPGDFDKPGEARLCLKAAPDDRPLPFPSCPMSSLSHMQATAGGFPSTLGMWLSSCGSLCSPEGWGEGVVCAKHPPARRGALLVGRGTLTETSYLKT